jgi:hypothetical protein
MTAKSKSWIYLGCILFAFVTLQCRLDPFGTSDNRNGPAVPATSTLKQVTTDVNPNGTVHVGASYARGTNSEAVLTCTYPGPDGSTQTYTFVDREPSDQKIGQEVNTSSFDFSLQKPGAYTVTCSMDGSSQSAPFTIKDTAPTSTPIPPQPAATNQPEPAAGVCQYQISGSWNVTQSNNYHPVFAITQDGTTLSGTATLTQAEAGQAGFSSNTGAGTGTLVGDQFTFSVTWQSAKGGIVTGVYTGTVTVNGIVDGKTGPGTWFATGGTAACSK